MKYSIKISSLENKNHKRNTKTLNRSVHYWRCRRLPKPLEILPSTSRLVVEEINNKEQMSEHCYTILTYITYQTENMHYFSKSTYCVGIIWVIKYIQAKITLFMLSIVRKVIQLYIYIYLLTILTNIHI